MSPFLYLKSINRIQPGTMLDVGTRDGQIASYFANAGYTVDAIDPEPLPGTTVSDGITFHRTSLEDFEISQTYDLVVASMVSQFVSYSNHDFVGRLKSLTKPDGLIYVTLLGEEDDWADNPKMKAITFEEALAILAEHDLTPLIRSIDWVQGCLYSGEPKFWHRFTFVVSN